MVVPDPSINSGGNLDDTNIDSDDLTDLNLNNTEIAFAYKSDFDLRRAQLLLHSFRSDALVKVGPKAASLALKLKLPIVEPLVRKTIRSTIFAQFCGGETIEDCRSTIASLGQYQVGSILDYSVEGGTATYTHGVIEQELRRGVDEAAQNSSVPFVVFKVTGLASFDLLEEVSKATDLNDEQSRQFGDLRDRVENLCQYAAERHVRIMIDAEESWIQGAIDRLAEDMMRRFNHSPQPIVYTTIQMYRHDRLAYLNQLVAEGQEYGFSVGVKLVRGAYMEKERARAAAQGYPSPIQPSLEATNRAYDEALALLVKHRHRVGLCAGTHNEVSTKYLVALLKSVGIATDDQRFYFSQLLGMSDNLTFNLVRSEFNVAKYVPYGPIDQVLPYLFRRAEENSSVRGQAGRELQLIEDEIKRRLQFPDRQSASTNRPFPGLTRQDRHR